MAYDLVMLSTGPGYRMSGAVSFHIDAAPATVWALVSDIERMGEWSPETYRTEWLDGASEPAVGARFRGYNRRSALERWSTTPTIRVCEPERELAFALGIKTRDFVVWRYRLEPTNGGTLLTESVTVRGWALYGLLRPRRRERQLIEGMRQTVLGIKRAAES
jgi:hypothetical protein